MTKQYRLATKDDIGKLVLYAGNVQECYYKIPLELEDVENFNVEYPFRVNGTNWRYALVEIPQVNEEFEPGELIEVNDGSSFWHKRKYLTNIDHKNKYIVEEESGFPVGYKYARKLQQPKPNHYHGQILTDEKTGERFEVRRID